MVRLHSDKKEKHDIGDLLTKCVCLLLSSFRNRSVVYRGNVAALSKLGFEKIIIIFTTLYTTQFKV